MVMSVGSSTPQSQSQPLNALRPFTRCADIQEPVVREYAGILPCTKQAARHILRCEHLRPVAGQANLPYKFEAENTHQIWIWYRELENPSQLQLVFRAQFDFSVPGRSSDSVAISVTDFIAEMLWECKNPRQVYLSKHTEIFWLRAVETKLMNLTHAPTHQERVTLPQSPW